ncbi:axotactin-like isoform X2 [Paramacrobiotus metropolitanus]|uniref:axotactin-like isoform X2 n=1 Tax=Paramacrobiotus metropolitanus TaxID=2943436 RepID=UPI00244564DD|nr:axotactin-like isoform X2 [Paramacrobiotus metropolitanus]
MWRFLCICILLPVVLSQEQEHGKMYTLSASKSSHISYQPPMWTATAGQHVAFRVRTRSLNAVLLHIDRVPSSLSGQQPTGGGEHSKDSHFVLKIAQGRLSLLNQLGERVEQFVVNQFVSDNEFHTLRFFRDIHSQNPLLRLTVDNAPENRFPLLYTALHHENPTSAEQDSAGNDAGLYTVTFGGKGDSRSFDNQLNGCLFDVKFGHIDVDGSTKLQSLTPHDHAELVEGCENRCETNNPCQNGATCFDDYSQVTCDCSATEFTGSDCAQPDTEAITLSGNQFISTANHDMLYRGYSRIRLDFKTRFPDGVLFHLNVKGHSDDHSEETVTAVLIDQYLRIIIWNPSLKQDNALEFKHKLLSDGQWHSLTVELKDSKIIVKIDTDEKNFGLRHLQEKHFFSPEVYIGYKPNLPNSDEPTRAETSRPFIGCLKRIYHGTTSILHDLHSAHPIASVNTVHESHELFPAPVSFTCSDLRQEDLSVALLSPDVALPLASTLEPYKTLQLSFRLPKREGQSLPTKIVGGNLTSGEEYKVILSDKGVHLELIRYDASGTAHTTTSEGAVGGNLHDGQWHNLFLQWPGSSERRKRQEEATETAASQETTPSADAPAAVELAAPAVENAEAKAEAVVEPTQSAETAAAAPAEGATAAPAAPAEVAAEPPVPVADAGVPVASAADADSPPVETATAEAAENPNARMKIPQFYGGQDTVLLPHMIRLHVDSQYVDLKAEEYMKLSPTGVVSLGGRPGDLGVNGCFRNIRVDDQVYDVRKAQNGVVGQCSNEQTCQEQNPCQNNAPCISGVFGPTCDCQNSGYHGKTCHLPVYAQTCADLYSAGERRSGVHIIDLDGSGPMKPVYVNCNMSNQEQRGITSVGHNFRSGTEIRDGPSGGRQYNIQYRQFDKVALKKLIDISKQCRQHISYRCISNAPLKLGTHTWFRSVADVGNITSFGSDVPGRCSCTSGASGQVCALDRKLKDLPCNCDADDNVDRVDEGDFKTKEFVGITNMTFIKRNMKGAGLLTLGPLECDGRENIERTVSFSSENSNLQFPTLGQTEDISFFFRTNLVLTKALLLYQPGRNSLRIVFSNATTITLYITISGRLRELSVVVPRPLNNQVMHLVRLEYGFNEVRLTADLNSNYLSWSPNDKVGPYHGPLYIGGYPSASGWGLEPGLVGCIQGLIRGGQTVDLTAAAEAAKSSQIRRECQSSCSPNPCKNNAECFDKFGGIYECICANPIAHSGAQCEHDINTKVFSLTNSTGSAFAYLKNSVPGDILRENISISFRTHRRTGILLYAHDNNNNFVQLHLQEGRKVIMTLNSANSIRRLEVTRDGLSDGRWHQLHVGRWENRVDLSVDFDNINSLDVDATVAGLQLYKSKPWSRATVGLETITPPRGEYATTAYTDAYVGGVRSTFNTQLTGFYGCLRGLRVGQNVIDVFNSTDPERVTERTDLGVVEGCEASCETYNPCQYGGMCINRWGDTEQPSECNCRNTSFTGANCTEDIGATFSDQSVAVVEYKPGRGTNFKLSSGMTVRLAFSTDYKPSSKVALLLVQFYDKQAELVIGLNEAGHVVVELYQLDPNPVRRIFPGNFADGNRHSVRVSASAFGASVQVDDHKEDVNIALGSHFVHYVMVGRVDSNALPVHPQHQGLLAYGPFIGCISNVRIESDLVEDVLQPLHLLLNHEEPSLSNARGDLNETQCALPLIVEPTAGLYDPSQTTGLQMPHDPEGWAWAVPIELPSDQIPKPSVAPRSNTAMIVGIVCGVFLLLVIIAVIIYMCRLRRRKANYPVNEQNVEENVEEKLLPHGGDPRHTIPPIYNNPNKPPSSNA